MKSAKIAAYNIFGIFTIKIPWIFIVLTSLSAFLALNKILRNPVVKKNIIVLPSIILFLIISSGLIAGSLQINHLSKVEYWQGEGRAMLTILLSIIILTLMNGQVVNIDKIVMAMSFLTLLFLLFWLAGSGFFSVAKMNHFGGLLTSHSGAGMCFGSLFIYAWTRSTSDFFWKVLATIFLIAAFLTASRLTVVALLGAFAIRGFHKSQSWTPGKLFGGLVSIFFAFYFLSITSLSDRFAPLFETQTYYDIVDVASVEYRPGVETSHGGHAHNILHRIVLWKYAIGRAASSPIWGTGFGTFNDDSRSTLAGIHISSNQRLDLGNAHNTFLHILSENGLLGLILVTFFYTKAIFANSNSRRNKLLYWHIMISGLFSHSLGAPSAVIPTLILALSKEQNK